MVSCQACKSVFCIKEGLERDVPLRAGNAAKLISEGILLQMSAFAENYLAADVNVVYVAGGHSA